LYNHLITKLLNLIIALNSFRIPESLSRNGPFQSKLLVGHALFGKLAQFRQMANVGPLDKTLPVFYGLDLLNKIGKATSRKITSSCVVTLPSSWS
jgi:hypothetical protein